MIHLFVVMLGVSQVCLVRALQAGSSVLWTYPHDFFELFLVLWYKTFQARLVLSLPVLCWSDHWVVMPLLGMLGALLTDIFPEEPVLKLDQPLWFFRLPAAPPR